MKTGEEERKTGRNKRARHSVRFSHPARRGFLRAFFGQWRPRGARRDPVCRAGGNSWERWPGKELRRRARREERKFVAQSRARARSDSSTVSREKIAVSQERMRPASRAANQNRVLRTRYGEMQVEAGMLCLCRMALSKMNSGWVAR